MVTSFQMAKAMLKKRTRLIDLEVDLLGGDTPTSSLFEIIEQRVGDGDAIVYLAYLMKVTDGEFTRGQIYVVNHASDGNITAITVRALGERQMPANAPVMDHPYLPNGSYVAHTFGLAELRNLIEYGTELGDDFAAVANWSTAGLIGWVDVRATLLQALNELLDADLDVQLPVGLRSRVSDLQTSNILGELRSEYIDLLVQTMGIVRPHMV